MFRLASHLKKTIRELLLLLDSHEIAEWQAYWTLEPFGELRADLRAGMIAATMANCHSTKHQFSPTDFLLFEDPGQKPAQSPEDMLRICQGITRRWELKEAGG